jgi:hypothetical protein
MRYWLYRWFMSFAHRHGWHKMDEFHPDGDTMLWCQWCGLRVVTKRHLTKHAPDGEPVAAKLAISTPEALSWSQALSRLFRRW